ncbi:MAG: ribonuclease HII [Oscillospiraceae bacterium]|nr:ribonuclease HII [Oscillospiraceae bacterium]
MPTFEHELALHNQGYTHIIGIDEAGRGPLAGDVYAAAVILPLDFAPRDITDSKKLTEKKREELFDYITKNCTAYGIGLATVAEIDQFNIRNAAFLAMKRAIDNCLCSPACVGDDAHIVPHIGGNTPEIVGATIGRPPSKDNIHLNPESQALNPGVHLLIDGNGWNDIGLPFTTIIKGDSKSLSIAAASILAKVSRDRAMHALDKLHPEYSFAQHKGYATAAHFAAIAKYGPLPIHRQSFNLKKTNPSVIDFADATSP